MSIVDTSSTSAVPAEVNPRPSKGSGLAISALILGIFSLVICLIPIINNGTYFTALIGLILGVIAFVGARKGKRSGKGMAFAGILTSVLAIVAAIISTIVYVSVLNSVGDAVAHGGKSVAAPSASSGATSPGAKASGPAQFKVGEVASISQYAEDHAATIKVSKVSVYTRALASFAQKPQKGTYKKVALIVTNTGTESFDINPYDFYFKNSAGDKFEYGTGHFSGYDGQEINATTLSKGERTSGVMIFDVPAIATQLVYAPGWEPEPIAVWTTK